MNVLRISPQRLLNDLAELATFGGRDDGGVDRIAGSPADLASRTWLANRITSAGLESWTDDIGNVFGKQRGSRGPWLLTGSHTDTVPAAGRLDGAYGALAAIEVLRTLHEAGHPSAAALQTVAFWDEEGVLPTSNGGLVGSTALSVSEHMKDISGYVELHIEQGPRMEDAGLELAVVDGIVGVDRYLLVIRGEANHAGTTPMINRHDAGRAASKIASHLWETADEVDETMVVNVGAMEFHPGVPNVVPGEAHLTVEFRAASEFALLAAGDRTLALTRRIGREQKCTVEVSRLSHKPVVRFDESYVDLIQQACVRQGVPTGRLVSYAGHDASVISSKVPTAMLFVPSTGGISHAPAEHTADEFLVQGAQVLLETLVEIEQTLPKPVYLH